MGVDYSANFGIGFKVNTDIKEDEENELYIVDILEAVLNDKYSYFEVGDGDYTGKTNDFYVVLDDIKPIETLEQRLEELKKHLLSEHLIYEDDNWDLVGGLNVW